MTGEHLAADVRALIRLFHAHRVRYLLVGGEAVIHHGYPRLTGDVDFCGGAPYQEGCAATATASLTMGSPTATAE